MMSLFMRIVKWENIKLKLFIRLISPTTTISLNMSIITTNSINSNLNYKTLDLLVPKINDIKKIYQNLKFVIFKEDSRVLFI
jgi:hypothetical protein